MLVIIGTIKIDSEERKRYFVNAIRSLEPVKDLFTWRLNIVGEFAHFAKEHIEERFDKIDITIDDTTAIYFLQRKQMDLTPPTFRIFTWQEDHWFVCPHHSLFRYLLDAFRYSAAEMLTVTHLITSWKRKSLLPQVGGNSLYDVRLVDDLSQWTLWTVYPEAYLTGNPAIYKWALADKILEFKQAHMNRTTLPEFELDPEWGADFIGRNSFMEMIPKFHVFREIAQESHIMPGARERAVREDYALTWVGLRDQGDRFGGGG